MTGRLWAGVTAPVDALRRTVHDPPLLRLQLAWSSVMMASWTVTVGLAVVAYDAGGTPAVALAVLARTVPGALAGPFLGALVDRWSHQRSLLWAAVVSAVGGAGAAMAASTLVAVVLLAAVVSLGTMVFRAAQSAVLPELVEDATELTAANVMVSAVEALGVFLGPAAAALLLAVQGPELTFGAAAGWFAVAAVLLTGRSARRPPAVSRGTRQRSSTVGLLRLPAARLLLLLALVQTVASGGLVVLYPALAVGPLNADLSAVGLLTAAFGLGGVVGSLGLFALAGSRRLGLLNTAALLTWSVPLLLVPLAPQLAPVLVLLAVVGAGNALFDVTSVTLLQRAVPRELLGRAFGGLEAVIVVGLGCGAAGAAVLAELLGPTAALATLAAPLALCALLTAPALRRLDRRLAAPVRQVAALRARPPFALLPPAELERLALHLQRVEVVAGQVVVQQGEPGTTYYVVETGAVEVAVDGVVVARLDAGEAFGEIALLQGGRRTATVAASVPSTLWSLDGSEFLAALGGGGGLQAAAEVARARLARAAPRSHT